MLENEGVALRSVCWSEIFPWLSIAKSFRLAVSLRLMTFGAAAVLLTLLGWWEIARLFVHEGAPNASWTTSFQDQSAWQVIDHSVPSEPSLPIRLVPAKSGEIDSSGLKILVLSPLIHTWALLSQPVWRIVSPASGGALTTSDYLSLMLSALWSLAVWAYFGAAISRVAAVQLATGEQVGWGASLRWAWRKWLAYFSAPVLPMLAIALVTLPIMVLGLMMKSDLLAFLAALIWPLVLTGGSVMTILLFGVLLGWPLMWATISVEGTDSFDALNRTYSYVFQRPLQYLFYAIVAALIGWLGWIVVETFAASFIWLASWAASWGAGSVRMQEVTAGLGDSSLAHAATAVIAFWGGCVKLLAIGYSLSYFGVASTAIYYLLRRDVDARESDEVFLDADISEEKFGLPKLQKDAAGAPEDAETSSTKVASADGEATAVEPARKEPPQDAPRRAEERN